MEINYLRENKIGRATFISLEKVNNLTDERKKPF
jgi:chromosome segregation ATPase